MSATETTAVPDEDTAPPQERREVDARSRTKPKRQPPYAVILHNDDLNGMDHVVGALRKVFHYGRLKAVWLMMQAHVRGRAVVWTGALEVAELKADQLRSCGADPAMKSRGATTLEVSLEPLAD